jgi:hypothetical protein
MQFLLLVCYFPGAIVRWIFLRKKYTFKEVSSHNRANGAIGLLLVFSIFITIQLMKAAKESRKMKNQMTLRTNIETTSAECDSIMFIYDAAIADLKNNILDSSLVRTKYESLARKYFGQSNKALEEINNRKRVGQFSREDTEEYDKKMEHFCDSLKIKVQTLKNLGIKFDLELP